MKKKLEQFRLEGINEEENNSLLSGSFPQFLEEWTSGTMGNNITNNKEIYSLQVYGKPGTQFYINSSLNPIELGPSGYYALELNDLASINRLEFDESNLKTLYSSKDYTFIPLVIDIKTKTQTIR